MHVIIACACRTIHPKGTLAQLVTVMSPAALCTRAPPPLMHKVECPLARNCAQRLPLPPPPPSQGVLASSLNMEASCIPAAPSAHAPWQRHACARARPHSKPPQAHAHAHAPPPPCQGAQPAPAASAWSSRIQQTRQHGCCSP